MDDNFTQIICNDQSLITSSSQNDTYNAESNRIDKNIWGLLRSSKNEIDDIKLYHRIDKNNRKDTYTIGRNSSCDVVVNDKRISSLHCSIYCDYSLHKMRVFIEDASG